MGPEADDAAIRSAARRVLRNPGQELLRPDQAAALEAGGHPAAGASAHNVQYLVDAVAKGKGVVLVTAHFGSFDMAVQVLAARSVQTNILVEALKPERLLDHVVSLRKSQGLMSYPPGPARFRPCCGRCAGVNSCCLLVIAMSPERPPRPCSLAKRRAFPTSR